MNAATEWPLSETSAARLHSDAAGDGEVLHFRLELFYLPGADAQACRDYHVAERAARGDYTPQLEAVRLDQKPATTEGSGVFDPPHRPGLPITYLEDAVYHQLFFICHSASWNEGERLLELVEYEPISPEQYIEYWGEEEFEALAADPSIGVLPPLKAGKFQWIARSMFEDRTGRREKYNTEGDTVDDTIKSRSFFKNVITFTSEDMHAENVLWLETDEKGCWELLGPDWLFHEAEEKGWTHG